MQTMRSMLAIYRSLACCLPWLCLLCFDLFCVPPETCVPPLRLDYLFVILTPLLFWSRKNGVRVVLNGPLNARQAFRYRPPTPSLLLLQGVRGNDGGFT